MMLSLLQAPPPSAYLLTFAILVTALSLALQIAHVEANGKGPIGIYAISRRYVLTADSNIDALVAVDLHRGGAVGSLKLHGPELDLQLSDKDNSNSNSSNHTGKSKSYIGGKDKSVDKGWVDPTGVASCDICRYIYLTSTHGHNFYQIELERTLLKMAEDGNFDALSNGKLIPVWPWDANATGVGEPTSSVRMLEVHHGGSVGYMAHRAYGLLRFFLDDDGRIVESTGDVLLGMDELETPDGVVAGLTLTGDDEERLLVTASRSTLIVGLKRRGEDKGVLEQAVDLQRLCNGDLGNNMWFRDAAIVADGSDAYLYVVGLFTPGQDGRGMSLYHLKQQNDGDWADCVNVAGPQKDRGGWRDGYGEDARFTRPHEFALLPRDNAQGNIVSGQSGESELSGDLLVLSDCDNRAIRTVKLTPGSLHRVSSVQYYDQDQWWPNQAETKSTVTGDVIVTLNYESSSEKSTFSEARDWCNQKAGGTGLCSLADMRNRLDTPSSEISTWTLDSCFGCWLRFPGVCDSASGGWDADYRIVATLYTNGHIRTECTQQEQPVDMTPLCCSRDELPISDTAAPTGKGREEGTYQSIIWLASAAGLSALFIGLCLLGIRCCRDKWRSREATYNVLEQLT